jgi:hypothetical protein
MVYGVDTHSHTGIRCSAKRQLGDQGSVFGFTAHGGAIFAVEGHIKNADSELLGHLSLQLQAFAHPRFDTAVMVTNRQQNACGLRTQQDVARMVH